MSEIRIGPRAIEAMSAKRKQEFARQWDNFPDSYKVNYVNYKQAAREWFALGWDSAAFRIAELEAELEVARKLAESEEVLGETDWGRTGMDR